MALKNKVQYKVAMATLAKLRDALLHIGEITNDAKLLKVYTNALNSEIEILENQIEKYEEKNDRPTT